MKIKNGWQTVQRGLSPKLVTYPYRADKLPLEVVVLILH